MRGSVIEQASRSNNVLYACYAQGMLTTCPPCLPHRWDLLSIVYSARVKVTPSLARNVAHASPQALLLRWNEKSEILLGYIRIASITGAKHDPVCIWRAVLYHNHHCGCAMLGTTAMGLGVS